MMDGRVRYIYRLKPGAGDEYDEIHKNVPDDLLELIRDAGIYNYTIWRHEEIVVCEFDTRHGFETSKLILSTSDAQREWTALLSELFEKIEQDGEPLWLTEVFHFD